MRCPHCGSRSVFQTICENLHHHKYCFIANCVREKWRADCGHEWTQWTCEK